MAARSPVYLDHLATTPPAPEVVAAMTEALTEHFGNPASATHAYGWAASALCERARGEIAALAGCEPAEVVFTSGATEANNLALRGVCATWPEPGRIVASNLEHSSVAATLDALADAGWEIVRVPCGPDGIVDAGAMADALDDRTRLATLTAAQNEIGTLQPWREVAAACRERDVVLHVDAAQAFGKVPLDFRADGPGLMSVSGHKIYGPKGIGALIVRRRDPRVALRPLLTGGGQERGLRPGSLNVPGIVGFGAACRLAAGRREADAARLRELAARLLGALADTTPGLRLNGDPERRVPGTLSLTFPGAPAARVMEAAPRLAMSAGAACGSRDDGPSRTLLALGLDAEAAGCTLRLALGRGTTEAEVDFAASELAAAVARVRREKGTA